MWVGLFLRSKPWPTWMRSYALATLPSCRGRDPSVSFLAAETRSGVRCVFVISFMDDDQCGGRHAVTAHVDRCIFTDPAQRLLHSLWAWGLCTVPRSAHPITASLLMVVTKTMLWTAAAHGQRSDSSSMATGTRLDSRVAVEPRAIDRRCSVWFAVQVCCL